MSVVFFFSGGASSMKAVLESPEHGNLYRVIGAVTNRSEKMAEKGWGVAMDHGIKPVYINPDDFDTREKFYEEVTNVVDEIGPEIVGFSGFLKKYSIVCDPFLRKYKNRILNVHPGNLALVTLFSAGKAIDIGRYGIARNKKDLGNKEWGYAEMLFDSGYERIYTGDDAVRMAVLFGEDNVRSSIHVIEKKVDGGKIVLRSNPKEVDTEYVERMLARNAYGRIVEYAGRLQEEMKTDCDAPAFIRTLELMGLRRLEINDDFVSLNGEILPYGGYQM
jgi:folate-dependent phosphoribosylglycinamide formyltransferase PurN